MRWVLCALALSTPAQAFCRATTCDTADSAVCHDGLAGCAPQIWSSGCLGYVVDVAGAEQGGIDAELARDAVRRAFATWLGADCGGGAPPSLAVFDLGTTSCGEHEWNPDGRNANAWLFRDFASVHAEQPHAHALTFTRFAANGSLLDADVEINTATLDVDLMAVLTHEAGHVLGLAHSEVVGAVMFPSYQPGSDALAADDVAAICAAYPPGIPRPSCDPTPRGGLFRRCGPSDVTAQGCSASSRSEPSPVAAALLLLALGCCRRSSR